MRKVAGVLGSVPRHERCFRSSERDAPDWWPASTTDIDGETVRRLVAKAAYRSVGLRTDATDIRVIGQVALLTPSARPGQSHERRSLLRRIDPDPLVCAAGQVVL
jgi:hypothetical protein